jgi:SPP1 gp7 family putative phage head morphogenesis protein
VVRGVWLRLLAAIEAGGGYGPLYHAALAALRGLPAAAGAVLDGLVAAGLEARADARRAVAASLPRGHREHLLGRVKFHSASLGFTRLHWPLLEARDTDHTDPAGEPDPLLQLLPGPSDDAIRRAVYATGWLRRVQSLTALAHPEQLAALIASGAARGLSTDQLAREVRPLVQGVQTSARRVARTAGLWVAHAVEHAQYEDALGDMIAGYTVHAVRDRATRPEHAARDGTTYYKRPRPGQKSMRECPHPPLEADGSIAFNCRCWLSPEILEEPPPAPPVQVTADVPRPVPATGAVVQVSTFDPGITARLPGVLADVFGPGATPHHVAAALGAGPGDAVRIGQARVLDDGTRYVSATVRTADGVTANRGVHLDPATGRRWVVNDTISAATTGTGAGTRLFARQVEQLAALGFDEIKASGDSGPKNGYYTLPRWGYDGPIPAAKRKRLPKALAGAETLQDLYATPAGRAWWKANGTSVDVAFDLRPGSRSRRALDAYLAEKAAPPKPPAGPPAPARPRGLAGVWAESRAATARGKLLLDNALANAGVDPDAARLPPLKARPSPRDLAGRLVSSWLEGVRLGFAPGEVAPVLRALAHAGAEAVGAAGEVAAYDPRLHDLAAGAVPVGGRVRVTRPGWVMREPGGAVYRLVSAAVEPA